MKLIVDRWSWDLKTCFELGDYLFGSVKLTKNTDPDKYAHSGYSIGFDAKSVFIIFGVDNSFSVIIDNKNKNILVFGEGPLHDLDNSTTTAEASCPLSFPESGKRFVLSLHYNGSNSFLFFNATKIYRGKAKGYK